MWKRNGTDEPTMSTSNNAPSRDYGEIIGSISSKKGYGDLKGMQGSSIAETKRLFRERRQYSSPGRRGLSRNSTPERRQNPSPDEVRRFDRPSNSRPPTPDRNIRPHTPDRRTFPQFSKSPSRTKDNGVSSTQEKTYHYNAEGISKRALSVSPGRRRRNQIDSSIYTQGLTTRVTNQLLSQHMAQKKEQDNTASSVSFKEELTQLRHYQIPVNEKFLNQGTIQTGKNIESDQKNLVAKIPDSEEISISAGTDNGGAGAGAVVVSQDDLLQTKNIVHTRSEQIDFYESHMKEKNNEIERLKLELKLSRKNEAKLELEVDIHDFKYSIYDDYRRLMDTQRLNGKDDKNDKEGRTELEQSVLSNGDIFSKLDNLEQLYEKSKTEASSRYFALYEEYKSAITKVFLLERDRSKGKNPSSCNKTSNTNSLAPTVKNFPDTEADVESLELLKKRIKILESDNLNYTLDLQVLRKELEKVNELQDESTSKKDKDEFNTLNLEKNALTNKIAALETEIGFTSGQIDDKTRTRRYRALEKSLNEYIAEIMSLEDKLKAKENIILRLKERDLAERFGSDKRNSLDHVSESFTKWYERNDNGVKASTDETSKSVTGEKDHEEVSTDLKKLRSEVGKNKGEIKMETRKTNQTEEVLSSSARIQMLRQRLNALAAMDHSSTCTEESRGTHFSEI